MDTKVGEAGVGGVGGMNWEKNKKKTLGQSVPSLGSLLLGLKEGDQFLSQCVKSNKQNTGTFIAMLSTM